MAALRWSYKLLPPHLKPCFAYCALFPKDHVFDEKELVEVWMAHDLIQTNVDGRPDDIGSHRTGGMKQVQYVMHDMIHDLALHVSNEEFSSAIGSLSTDQKEKVRHITIIIDNEYSNNLSLCKRKRILTVYTPYRRNETSTIPLEKDILLEVFKHSKSLRVLVLSNEYISEIPECISELKHLRYLDVKKTNIKSLPYSLCQLLNLQMLAAPRDVELPKDIVNICRLRCIRANLSTCKGVGKLASLQELSSIHVCKSDNIRELGDMQILRGELRIEGLESVEKLEDDVGALMEKQTLIGELELVFEHSVESTISAQVIDAIGCPPNLKLLKIVGYTGVKPLSWMVDGKLVADLQSLILSKCHQFEFSQLLGEVRSVKGLTIKNCTKIKRMDFSCLPSLRRLDVTSCDELISISGLVAVKYLSINNCKKVKSVKTNFQGLDSLQELKILDCPLLESIHEQERSTSSSSPSTFLLSSSPWSRLLGLQIDNEKIFRNIFEQDFISDIRKFVIRRNSMLVECLGEIMKNSLKSFKNLYIGECHQLQSLPTGCLPHSLESLAILDCPQLQSLPADGLPPFLRYLQIKGCPLLYERCKDESGLDWHKINHIPNKDIRQHW